MPIASHVPVLGCIVILMLETEEETERPREAKSPAVGHTAGERQPLGQGC